MLVTVTSAHLHDAGSCHVAPQAHRVVDHVQGFVAIATAVRRDGDEIKPNGYICRHTLTCHITDKLPFTHTHTPPHTDP